MLLLPTLVKLKAFLEVVFVALFADEHKRRVFLYVERILTDWLALSPSNRVLVLGNENEVWVLDVLNMAFAVDVYYKLSAAPKFALHVHWPSHLLDDVFTNRKAEPRTLQVSARIFIKLTKVYEQVFDPFWRDTAACVYNSNFHFEESFLPVNALFFFTALQNPSSFTLRLRALRKRFLFDQLVLQNINPHSDGPLLVGELQSIGQKVDEHLNIPPLVPENRLNQL